MAEPAGKITYRRQIGGDGYLVFEGEERIGWVQQDGAGWRATDNHHLSAGKHSTRAAAGKALIRRQRKIEREDRP